MFILQQISCLSWARQGQMMTALLISLWWLFLNHLEKEVLHLACNTTCSQTVTQVFWQVWFSAKTLARLWRPVGQTSETLDKQREHGCSSRSIGCVQTEGSNNSIAAANSLTAWAQVQKKLDNTVEGPHGICCLMAISFNKCWVSQNVRQKKR